MTKTQETQRKVLGRGLSSLLANRAVVDSQPGEGQDSPTHLPIDQIDPNPLQPRRVFHPDKLQELAQSIIANGIVQPLAVRAMNGRYQIVAGERRWRAAQIAGLATVPVTLHNVSDEKLLELTLIENIQRENLNPIETALAFDRMVRELHLSHEEIGRRTGKDRSTISNFLRLLQLPSDLQQLVAEAKLSQGHARCLLGLPAELQREVAEKAVAQGMSVRQVERLTQRMSETRDPKSPEELKVDPNVRAAIEHLESVLGTRVRITNRSEKSGRIEIDYYSARI